MSISIERKQTIIKDYGISENDTGSAEIQCAILTERINNLIPHFKTNKKDYASNRGLLMLIGRRRRLLAYLKKNDFNSYSTLIQKLNLRK